MAPPEAKASAPGGVQVEHGQVYGVRDVSPGTPVGVLNYVLRFAALALALVAAIVFGVAKETVTGTDDNGDVVQVTLKAIKVSAVKYFVAANVIAAAYSTASLVLSIVSRGASSSLALILTLLDVVMVALLFSANGAGSAIAVIARKGEGDIWTKICDVAGKFCDSITASIVLSMFAALAYVVLVVFGVLTIHKKAQY
ncbi:hypothetical protein Taro_036226 [Colocasia esculenta]|uniref:CASP-like protein n=1 Tax=Colocasia esculenta TaxID=4460 RepID=A0A843W2J1_COLES|nr:hypothetical protein [Colocasia esculenta]